MKYKIEYPVTESLRDLQIFTNYILALHKVGVKALVPWQTEATLDRNELVFHDEENYLLAKKMWDERVT